MTTKIVRAIQVLLTFFFLSSNLHAEIETQTAFTPEMLFQNAIKKGQLDDVRTLLENGFDVNKPLEGGVAPLHAAIINNQENIAIILIQAGAKLDTPDASTHATPLHMAALYGRTNIVELLIQKGANINALMKFDITSLQVAAQFNQISIVEILLKNKANVNHVDQEGFTALHMAAQNGDEIITRLLIDAGAKINIRDKTKKATPLMIAEENNHANVALLLRERGAE
jgi:ankyrin